MANIIVSNICNSACPYCFAKENLVSHHSEHQFITIDQYIKRLDFLDASGISEVRLLGGEPTLHPQFNSIIDATLERSKSITLFTNGFIPEKSLRRMESIPENRCSILINMNSSKLLNMLSHKEKERFQSVLLRLGNRAFGGFTIYEDFFSFDESLNIIDQTNIHRKVRLGIAQPVLGGHNVYIHPNKYRNVAKNIVKFAHHAAKEGISLDFDCGFVRCMFSNEEIEMLRQLNVEVNFSCSPILDINMNDRVLYCFSLGDRFSHVISQYKTTGELHDAFVSDILPYRIAGIFKECSSCPLKNNGECTGGCMSTTMMRFFHKEFQVQGPCISGGVP